MILLRGMDGVSYRRQNEIKQGGEGVIYTLEGRDDILAKIYKPELRTGQRETKLRAMLADPPRDEMRERQRHASISWPMTLLREGDRFAGYLMPRIFGGHILLNAYNRRAAHFKVLGFDWRDQHQVATNLCIAIYDLHEKGYVIGDVNAQNALVTSQGLVTLIDTDSFQVRANGSVYRCPVGTPEYTPRELQGQYFERIDRTLEHDRFGLAVLVFKLLMDGHHPLNGALKNPSASIPSSENDWFIEHGVFPWVEDPRFNRPKNARRLEELDPRLRELFVRCFKNGHVAPSLRPSAKEWFDALNLAAKRLVPCDAGIHWRYPESASCHACKTGQPPSPRALAASGRGLSIQPPNAVYPGPSASSDAFNLTQVWSQIMAVASPGDVTIVDPSSFFVTAKPLPSALIGFLSFLKVGLRAEEKARRQNALNAAEAQFRDYTNRWKNEAGASWFLVKINELSELRKKYEALTLRFEKEMAELLALCPQKQRIKFLEQFLLRDHSIPGLGPTRLKLLVSSGIKTAAQIEKRKLMNVKGIGEKMADELEYWRMGLERRFVFDPSIGVDPADIAALNHRFAGESRGIEFKLLAGPAALKGQREHILLRRSQLFPEMQAAALKLAQAKADLLLMA